MKAADKRKGKACELLIDLPLVCHIVSIDICLIGILHVQHPVDLWTGFCEQVASDAVPRQKWNTDGLDIALNRPVGEESVDAVYSSSVGWQSFGAETEFWDGFRMQKEILVDLNIKVKSKSKV